MSSFSNQSLGLCQWSSETGYTQNLSSQNYLSLLITPKDATSHNLETKQKQPLTNNILPAIITEDKSLTAIFPFELKEPVETLLFNKVTLESKLITAMYTDIKQLNTKLLLKTTGCSKPMQCLTETPKNCSSVKMATTCMPATCSYFKTTTNDKPLIKLEKKEKKPTWKAYQVSWADAEHNELLPVLSWDNKKKKREKDAAEKDTITKEITRKNAIKLEPHLCTCIDLKVAIEILAMTIVQLASRSSLVKKGINIKRRIIDMEYVRNIIAMLQNDSKKAYIIEPNEKIT
ncbi:hypothetical protein G9A89_009082 [Geosiphon pyriformis]|nr:hypothetical protein G9A89_009082 [Geosiphon pyriformis]